MASSNPRRDNGASDGKGPSDNPFVKFKNAIDYHVGSVLQGIIGLPTVLSQRPDVNNGRWAGLNSDSPQSQDGPRRTGHEKHTFEDTSFPFRFHGLPPKPCEAFDSSDHDGDDYDLYSAFNDSFAERIERITEGHPWLNVQNGEKLRWRGDGSDNDVQKGVQQRFHASLVDYKSTHGTCEDPTYVDDKTLAPYLLFSPYSPLALMSMPPLKPKDERYSEGYKGPFTYCDAFEDLLRISTGKPMRDLESLPLQRLLWSLQSGRDRWPAAQYGFFVVEVANDLNLADMGMVWMGTALVESNVFRERPLPAQVDFHPKIGPIYYENFSTMDLIPLNFMQNLRAYPDNINSQDRGSTDATTEQEMYDRFAQYDLDKVNDSTHLAKIIIELSSMLREQNFNLEDDFGNFSMIERFLSSGKLPSSSSLDKSSNDGRVVITETSTTHRADKDGTVRTVVVVEKLLQNGRVVSVKETHTHTPLGEQVGGLKDPKQSDDDTRKGDGKGETE